MSRSEVLDQQELSYILPSRDPCDGQLEAMPVRSLLMKLDWRSSDRRCSSCRGGVEALP